MVLELLIYWYIFLTGLLDGVYNIYIALVFECVFSSGYLQAHISYLDEGCQTCLLLLSVDRESFFTLSECKNKILEV